MGSARELLRSYFIYAVALMLPSLLSLVTIPIVTRSLMQSEYGLVEFATLAGVLTFAVFSLSVGEGFARFYALARSDFARSLALRTYLLLTLALGALAACAFFLLLPTIVFFESSATITAGFRLAATAVAVTGFLSGVAVTVFRWLDRPSTVLVCTAAGALAYALAILGLHWLDRLDVDSYLWATSLGAIANICGLVLVVRGELQWSDLEWRHVAGKARRLIAYSMPMLISTVLVFLNQYIDRAIVAKYLGASELGGYAIGVKMAGLFLLVLKPLKLALTPYVFAAAKQEKGFELYVNSGYRSYLEQVSTYNYWVQTNGQAYADRTSARPGHSEHQLGTTADVAARGLELEAFSGTPEAAWIAANSYKYGFIVSYPDGKEAITGYAPEPWHIRYVGKDVAQQVKDSGLTLHEFLLK